MKKSDCHVVVTAEGPYLLYGRPPMAEQFIMCNTQAESWYYQQGRSFSVEGDPTRLCRCGASHNKPYCDGEHLHTAWDGELTADEDRILDDAVAVEGDDIILADNEKYCVYARFCHPQSGAWHLTEESSDPQKRELAIRESMMCPSARLMMFDKGGDAPHEFKFDQSVGVIEDPQIGVSGGLWLRGGIAVAKEYGSQYELRNRVVLCRCGASHNKPYCDGSHASIKWQDELHGEPIGDTLPTKVY
ncbi:MAG: CDGSH iron-sulfur domain-containing protein [Rikenellaceae bacterium]